MLCDIFLDADETLLDYKKAERTALEQAAGKFGAPFGPEFLERYGEINQSLWRAFERGEITRAALGPRRFQELFEEYGMEADPEEANRFYMTALGKGSFLLPGALEICRCLSERYRLSIITNGSTAVQKNRLEASGLRALCTGCFYLGRDGGAEAPEGILSKGAFRPAGCRKRNLPRGGRFPHLGYIGRQPRRNPHLLV